MDLLDINVWLALLDRSHVHHRRARGYWQRESRDHLAFCRVSMLGLLRLGTNGKAMHGQPFTPQEAWTAYRALRGLPEIQFLFEPSDIEARMATWSDLPTFPVRRWTDCYLAALAAATGCRLVSFDSDYRAFAGLDYLHLVA